MQQQKCMFAVACSRITRNLIYDEID